MTSTTHTFEQTATQEAQPRDASARPVFEMVGVTRSWNRGRKTVVRDINLALEPGTAAWVGGRNGVGKTTMLRVAAGLIAADEGHVSLCGLNPERHRREYQRQLGFLTAGNSGLYARLTVRGHLDYWSRLALLSKSEREGAVERALARFELDHLAGSRVDRMSLGQRQRVRLAMTFLHEPSLLLLDEPGNSLDQEGKTLLSETVRRTVDGGGAAIWCSPTGEHLDFEFDERYEIVDGHLESA
jgi:ABC-2 type transport system ATP-binding protein